jgi:hypothetical protein
MESQAVFPKSGELPTEYESHDAASSDRPSTTGMKKYNMYYTTSRTNVKIHRGNGSTPCLYYGQTTILTKQPQLQLRAGDSSSAPMVAFAKIHFTSRHILIGSGDFQKDPEGSLIWEEMHREKNVFRHSDYKFGSSIGAPTRRNYTWQRDPSKKLGNIYTCVNDEGKVISIMRSGGMLNYKKGGEIEILEGLDQKLEELLMISSLAIWIAEAGGAYRQGYQSGQSNSEGSAQ